MVSKGFFEVYVNLIEIYVKVLHNEVSYSADCMECSIQVEN